MDVQASAQPPGQEVWHHVTDSFLAVGVWTEKKPDRGEDAEPLLAHHVPSGEGIAAVFDGAGGAGAADAGRFETGPERTNAWVGARFVRALVEEWFVSGDHGAGDRAAESLRVHLSARLAGLRRPSRRRKIMGTMRRELPTTLAALKYHVGGGAVRWDALWAGDSRCYLLDARTGLQQLSRDDTESGDALVLLTEDPPMTNMVSADRPFHVNVSPGYADLPCVLICATDGFFGYVSTPAEFEHVLLRTLRGARTPAEWGAALADDVRGYTGDDASMIVLAFGFGGLADLQRHLEARAERVFAEHAGAIGLTAGDRDALVHARQDSWNRYRENYERLMPANDEGVLR